MRQAKGFTLIELIVVIAIIAVTTGLSSLALTRIDASPANDRPRETLELRREAIRAGKPITRAIRIGTSTDFVTALPDGRIIGDAEWKSSLRKAPYAAK